MPAIMANVATSRPIVLRTLRCFHCTARDRLEPAPETGMHKLPDDCVPIPEDIVSLADCTQQRCYVFASVSDDELCVFVYGEAIILSYSTRDKAMRGRTRYKGPVLGTGQDWYKLDQSLIDKLNERPGKQNDPSKGKKAVGRLKALLDDVKAKHHRICHVYHTKRASIEIPLDSRTIDLIVGDSLSKMHELSGQNAVETLIKKYAMAYGVAMQAQQPRPIAAANSLDMKAIIENNANTAFGLTEKEAMEFHHMQANGVRVCLNFRLVGRRSKDYVFTLPDGKPWDKYLGHNTKSSDTHMSTLKRMVFMAQKMPAEYVQKFAVGLSDTDREALGCSLPYVTENGSATYIDALQFLETGFYAACMHVACVPIRKTREAIVEAGKGSLVQALQAYARYGADPSEKAVLMARIDDMNLAWETFFGFAQSTFHLVQTSYSEHKDIPDAWETLHMLYDLDTSAGTTPVKLLLRSFLGIAFFCGLRSGEIAQIRVSTFEPTDSKSYKLLVPHKDKPGILILKVTSNKTMANGLKRIELPAWLSTWILEYERDGRPQLNNPQHSGLFVTKTGQPLHPRAILGRSSKKVENRAVISMLRHVFPVERVKQLTNYTDLRGIFFQTNSVHVSGSMLAIFANAREFLEDKKRKPCDEFLKSGLELPGTDEIKRGMARLNASSVDQADRAYSEKTLESIPFTLRWYDAAKRFAWHVLSTRPKAPGDASPLGGGVSAQPS